MRPQDISINNFTYELPNDRIAQTPLPERDASKLLIYRNGNISQDIFRNVAQHIPGDSLLVLNDTRVIQARIFFQKPTGGVIEIFCLNPHSQYPGLTTAMSQEKKVQWYCLIGGASKWKPGQVLEKKIESPQATLYARYIDRVQDTFLIEFSWEEEFSFADILSISGVMPLPPYIKRTADRDDVKRYQAIFARYDGSVAAPTASLHFSEQVLHDIDAKKIRRTGVTLHVGAGTFKPVKSETMAGHEMHEEYFEVSGGCIQNLLHYTHHHIPITATGTTTLRAIESIYWLGVKLIKQPDLPVEQWVINQWDAYELEKENIPVEVALQEMYRRLNTLPEPRIIARTQLLIAPGYSFKIPSALITNFHQPQSTLLLLVAAFAGENWRKIYQYALDNDFRFLSYGDSSILFRS